MSLQVVHGNLRDALASATAADTSYKDSLFEIVNYAGQVHAYQLPVLTNPSIWPGGAGAYQQTVTTWSVTTGTLQGWAQGTLKNLTALPGTLLQNGTQVVSPTLKAAVASAEQLVTYPKDEAAKANLHFTLSTLAINFGLQAGLTAPLIASMQGQSMVFDQNATLMASLAADALKAAGNARKEIEQLNQDIRRLESEIKAAAAAIAGGSLAAVLGIGMGILAVVLAPATGGVSLFLLIPAILITGGGAYIVALNAKKIVDAKEAIKAAANKITTFNADVASVNTMAGTLSGLSGQVESMKSALNTIVAPWVAAQTYFAETESTIDNLGSSTEWQQVLDSLVQIQTQWGSFMTTVEGLQLNTDVRTKADLTLTMSQEQVEATLSRATPIPIIQYLAA